MLKERGAQKRLGSICRVLAGLDNLTRGEARDHDLGPEGM